MTTEQLDLLWTHLRNMDTKLDSLMVDNAVNKTIIAGIPARIKAAIRSREHTYLITTLASFSAAIVFIGWATIQYYLPFALKKLIGG